MTDGKPVSTANQLAQTRTDLAGDRTMMAADRTLMAWIRTALAMISFGFTIYKFLSGLRSRRRFISTVPKARAIWESC